MTVQRLVEGLLGFGFTGEQAEIYLFLLRIGPCPAGIIARRLEISRMKAYRTLKALEERGLVNRIIGRPMKFVAAPMKEALETYIDEVRAKLSKLETTEGEIVEQLDLLTQNIESSMGEPIFRIYQGRQQIYDLLVQMCARASEEIYIATTGNDLARLTLLGIDDNLKASAKEGTRISVLTQIEERNSEDIEGIFDLISVRHLSLPAPIRFVVIDKKEALTTVAMDDSMSMTTQNDTGIWTNASSYVTAMKVFFDALWRTAPEAGIVIETLRTGRTPQEIRIITTNEEYIEAFLEMIKRSRTSIYLLVNSIQDLPISIETLQAHSKKINLRILTSVDSASLDDINKIHESASIMHREGTTDLGVMIIDGSEVLLNIQGWGATGQAIWSNLKTYVETMILVFEDYWRVAYPVREITTHIASQQVQMETLKPIRDALEQSGWTPESPGSLTGKSGLTHSFDLVARKLSVPDKNIALELLTEGNVFNELIELGVKTADLKPTMILLASTIPTRKEETDLARLYGIKVVQESDTMSIARKVVDEANSFLKI